MLHENSTVMFRDTDVLPDNSYTHVMTHTIETKKNKHINWKFEYVGLKCQFYERLDNMLVAAPGGLLRVNRGTDANGLTDLLTFMSNAILKSSKQIFGMRKPSKFNVPGRNE